MRITLLHNPKAGRKEFTGKQLTAALRDAGHKVTYRSIKGRSWSAAMAKPADLIIAAGGDGTVGKVARRLAGRKTPLSVLPLGTANNLARTLGFDQPVQKLIARIGEGKLKGFDVGLARGPWGSRYVFEGIGAGLLAEYLRLPKGRKGGSFPRKKRCRSTSRGCANFSRPTARGNGSGSWTGRK
jgi:diacylglycerol kinase family enzyme